MAVDARELVRSLRVALDRLEKLGFDRVDEVGLSEMQEADGRLWALIWDLEDDVQHGPRTEMPVLSTADEEAAEEDFAARMNGDLK